MTRTRLLRILGSLVGIVLLEVALGILRHQLRDVTGADVLRELRALPMIRVWGSVLLTIGGYLALAGSDLVSLRHLGRNLSLGKTLLTSFVGYAFANSLPFAFRSDLGHLQPSHSGPVGQGAAERLESVIQGEPIAKRDRA